jgi:hypothetical protein
MDAAKRNIRGLLTSLLLQLVDDSDRCWDLLSQLHKACRDGSEQPSEAKLAQCLKSMLDLPGQHPTYIIVDALDECPNRTGTPPAREKVPELRGGSCEVKPSQSIHLHHQSTRTRHNYYT